MTKIGFFSDVHGNYEALTAVLSALDNAGCDMILCLGDIVGYGASPSECVQLIRQREIPCVMGNHDEYVTMLMDSSIAHLRDEIKKSIQWTQGQLSMDDLKWLSKLPKRMQLEGAFVALHSSFASSRWAYCMDEASFAANFARQPAQLAFCGHSHAPLIGIEVPGHNPFVDFIRPYTIPSDQKVMVNVGSCGQPRDRDNRACCCIFELESRHLELLRVPYDIEMAQNKIYMARLPDRFGDRLEHGK